MRILVLNGSPRPKGNTKQMVDAFREDAESAGHKVDVVDIRRKKISGCLACEYCHTKGNGVCVQREIVTESKRAFIPRISSFIYRNMQTVNSAADINRMNRSDITQHQQAARSDTQTLP